MTTTAFSGLSGKSKTLLRMNSSKVTLLLPSLVMEYRKAAYLLEITP